MLTVKKKKRNRENRSSGSISRTMVVGIFVTTVRNWSKYNVHHMDRRAFQNRNSGHLHIVLNTISKYSSYSRLES